MDIDAHVQTTLDSVLFSEGIYVFKNRRVETSGENPNGYVTYTKNGDIQEDFSDDVELVKRFSITVIYHYHETLLLNKTGRDLIKRIEELIYDTLVANGFEIPYGGNDVGDTEGGTISKPDGSGYNAVVYECDYWRVV